MKKILLLLIFGFLSFYAKSQATFQKSLSADFNYNISGLEANSLLSSNIQSSPDGTAVYIAGVDTTNRESNLSVIKMSRLGNVEWAKRLKLTNLDYVNLRITTFSNGLLVSFNIVPAFNQINTFMIKMGLNGDVLWQNQLGKVGSTRFSEIQKDDDETIWLTGITGGVSDTSFSFLAQIRKDGSVLACKKLTRVFTPRSSDAYSFNIFGLAWNKNTATMNFIESYKSIYGQVFNTGATDVGDITKTFLMNKKGSDIRFSSLQAIPNGFFFTGRTTLRRVKFRLNLTPQ
ncbi:MAG: hypothetical protein U5L45_02495 [Saprospiraceae bacterium]|nr:hypothetical protein [Saprospiraceae bacterium]